MSKSSRWSEPVVLESRKSWPKSTIAAVWLACDGKCWCGSKDRLEIDHRLPLALGGGNGHDNLWLLCYVHHKAKTTRADIPAIWKAKRLNKKNTEPKPPSKLKGRGFDKRLSKGFDGKVRARHEPDSNN